MKKYKRVFVIVLDSLGIGKMHDSEKFGDIDVDTLGHIAESVDKLNIPNLQRMGLANLHPIKNVEKVDDLRFNLSDKMRDLIIEIILIKEMLKYTLKLTWHGGELCLN